MLYVKKVRAETKILVDSLCLLITDKELTARTVNGYFFFGGIVS
jgi:hypothetical protein